MSGRFIVFEGIDGSGKTTQTKMLAEALRSKGYKVTLTAEPTELPTGRALRQALGGGVKLSECQMATLFVEDRIAHNIEPEAGIQAIVDRGEIVICDRYYYSTLAYQGHSTDYDWVKSMNLACPEIRKPDLCVYIDLLPEQSLERIAKGRDSVEIYENTDTLTRVRRQFLSVIEDIGQTDKICVVDGYRTPDQVAADVLRVVESVL